MNERKATCPSCGNPLTAPVAAKRPNHFPFCSERCKMLDLGNWLTEKYRVPDRQTQIAESASDDE